MHRRDHWKGQWQLDRGPTWWLVLRLAHCLVRWSHIRPARRSPRHLCLLAACTMVRLWRMHELLSDSSLADSPNLPKVSQLIQFWPACLWKARRECGQEAGTRRHHSECLDHRQKDPSRPRPRGCRPVTGVSKSSQSWYGTANAWSKSL